MKILQQKWVSIFIIFTTILGLYIFMFPQIKYSVVNAESLILPYISHSAIIPKESILQIFTSSNHSWYIFSVVQVFIERYLPEILNMHPQTCASTISSNIYFIFFIIFLFAITNSYKKYTKGNFNFPFIFLITTLLMFTLLEQSEFKWFFTNKCWFLAYIFLSIFGVLLLDKLQKYYVLGDGNYNLSKHKKIILALLFFAVAISNEYYKFLLVYTIFFVYLIDRIFKISNFKNTKKFLLLFSGLVLLNSANCITRSFTNTFSLYTRDFQISNIASYLPAFTESFIEYILLDNILFFTILAILLCLIHKFVENKVQNKKFIIWTFVTLTSIFTFMFCTIFLRGEHYYLTNILEHSGFRLLAKITLTSMILSAIGYLNKYATIRNEKNKNIISYTLLLSTLIFSINPNTFDYTFQEYYIKEIKKNMYVLEKVYTINNTDTFYNYFSASIFNPYATYYLYNTYGGKYKPLEYKVEDVCSIKNDSKLYICRENLEKLAKEKFNLNITSDELEELKFENIKQKI